MIVITKNMEPIIRPAIPISICGRTGVWSFPLYGRIEAGNRGDDKDIMGGVVYNRDNRLEYFIQFQYSNLYQDIDADIKPNFILLRLPILEMKPISCGPIVTTNIFSYVEDNDWPRYGDHMKFEVAPISTINITSLSFTEKKHECGYNWHDR